MDWAEYMRYYLANDSRLVLWTWRRMTERTRVVWRRNANHN